MSSRKSFICVLCLALLLPLFYTPEAKAIPAFSRQHKTECTTCHTLYPELNEFGGAFQKNAYVWPGVSPAQKAARKLLNAPTGGAEAAQGGEAASDGGAKPGTNEAFLLAGIPEILPISFTASIDLAYDQQANDRLNMSTRSLRLLAGGAFRDKVGFYTTFTAYTQGRYDPLASNAPGSTSSNIGELFLVWRHALDTPVNIKIGRFEPKTTLWKKNNRIIITDYAPYSYKVGNSQFTTHSPTDAIEANAVLGSRLFVAGGAVDRDDQNTKEGFGHVSYKFGGTDFLGHEPEVDLDNDSIWDFLTITVAGYSHFGRNESADIGNYFYRAGVDLDLVYKRLRFKFGGVKGRDSNPNFASNAAEFRSNVLASEVGYLFGSPINFSSTFRYEHQDDGTGITRRYIPAIAFTPLQNTKLSLEYKYETTPTAINRLTLAGLTFSF